MRSKFEIVADKELKSQGYLVDYKMRPTRPNPYYNTDFFNLFDLMAYKPGELRFISIKGTMGILKSHLKAVEEFKLPDGCIKEIWSYRKLAGKGNKFIPRKVIVNNGR